MNTDWHVKPLSQKSSISGQTFKPGAHVACYIYSDPNVPNELLRTDILVEESTHFSLPENLLARWTRIVRERGDCEQKESQKQALDNAEEFFLSLYEEFANNDQENTKLILKQLLGLMLERKRILRRLKNNVKDITRYLHRPSKREYEVPQITLALDEIAKIQEQLTILIND